MPRDLYAIKNCLMATFFEEQGRTSNCCRDKRVSQGDVISTQVFVTSVYGNARIILLIPLTSLKWPNLDWPIVSNIADHRQLSTFKLK